MSRLFTEFYFKDQVEYPDHIPTSTADISNCASDIKRLSSAIDSAGFSEDDCNYSQELENLLEQQLTGLWELEDLLEQQLTGLWELEDYFEEIGISLAAEQIRESRNYRSKYYSSKTILNNYIFRYSTKLFDAFPDARFCVDLNRHMTITEKETKTRFRIEEWYNSHLRLVPPSTKELNAFQDYYNPTLNEIVLYELEFNKEYPLRKMIEFYEPEVLKQE